MGMGRTLVWVWLAVSVALATYIGLMFIDGGDKSAMLPGPSTDGHHQIELACEACHLEPFGGGELLQTACMQCHEAELKRAEDSHPQSKFTDPRNVDTIARLDARYCVTCHREHQPALTRAMGVTLAGDFCAHCHRDIADDRPSHEGVGFDTCASAGCHNFHDNRALYEDFLLKHADQPVLLGDGHPTLPSRTSVARMRELGLVRASALGAADADAPPGASRPDIVPAWLADRHAEAGVNCGGCHAPEDTAWRDRPDTAVCADCHAGQYEGFTQGRHGMRLPHDGLGPMTVAQARLPMREDAASKQLTCTSCHGAHEFDTRGAAVDACLGCHADDHSLAYWDSPHAALWREELLGQGEQGSGVSCASCHMPREVVRRRGEDIVHVQHNQNDNLRPNEKMIRSVCMTCHGLPFSIDALADPALVRNNFQGKPAEHVPSVDMAVTREVSSEQTANTKE